MKKLSIPTHKFDKIIYPVVATFVSLLILLFFFMSSNSFTLLFAQITGAQGGVGGYINGVICDIQGGKGGTGGVGGGSGARGNSGSGSCPGPKGAGGNGGSSGVDGQAGGRAPDDQAPAAGGGGGGGSSLTGPGGDGGQGGDAFEQAAAGGGGGGGGSGCPGGRGGNGGKADDQFGVAGVGGNGGDGEAGCPGGNGGQGGDARGQLSFSGAGGRGGNSCGGFGKAGQSGSQSFSGSVAGGAGGAGGPGCAPPDATCAGGSVVWSWTGSGSSPLTATARLQVINSSGTIIYDNTHSGSRTMTLAPGTYKGQISYNGTGLFSAPRTITCAPIGVLTPTPASGNVINLNFAISNSIPWMQSYDLNMRFDNGYKFPLPLLKYASAISDPLKSRDPGIIFTGNVSPDFGQGQASVKNWVVGGASYPEEYKSFGGSQTSYQYLFDKAARAGITPINLSARCTISNCTLPANLASGVYIANGNLNLNSYTFPANRNYVFLIDGILTIKSNIIVPNTSTVIFSSKQDIRIDQTVGAAPAVIPPAGQVQGFYSADRDFIIGGINDCAIGADKMLNMEGAIIANAEGIGGEFINQRDLCGQNATVPSFTIKPRTDFILNAPSFLRTNTTISREEAP